MTPLEDDQDRPTIVSAEHAASKLLRYLRDASPETLDAVLAIVKGAVAAEREANAKMADDHSTWGRSFGAEKICEMIAKAIRARTP